MTTRATVLAVYKRLLRQTQQTFKGDRRVEVAFVEIRKKFEQNRGETEERKIQKMIKIAMDAENILKRNVVQATRKGDSDTFGKTRFVSSIRYELLTHL